LFGYNFYFTDNSYRALGSGLAITKTCSGVNLFISLYSILVLGFLHQVSGRKLFYSLIAFASALALAFCFTLLRIVLSLPIMEWGHYKLAHTVLSLCIFFGACFFVYWLAQKIIGRYHNATEN